MKRYLRKVFFCSTENIDEVRFAEDGVLYLADNEVCLKKLREKHVPAAAWLHENNRDQDLSAASYAVENPQELDMDFYEKIYRREKNVPWDILETERCLVREMLPEDAEGFAKMYTEPAVNRYMKDYHGSAEGEARYIREYQKQYRFFEYGVWSIVLKETGELIGRAGFSEHGGIGADSIDSVLPGLGYMIGAPWQGRGLAYEVCKAILVYAKEELGFEAVQLLVESGNEASIKLADKLGFSETEILHDKNGCQVARKVLSLG